MQPTSLRQVQLCFPRSVVDHWLTTSLPALGADLGQIESRLGGREGDREGERGGVIETPLGTC